MGNNIAVSITADVAGLQAKRAIASAELKTLQKDLNDLAKTANSGGLTGEMTPELLKAGAAVQTAQTKVAGLTSELKKVSASGAAAGLGAVTAEAKVATAAVESLHTGTAGITREFLVLGREASRGNLTKMAGSATILAQRMGLLTPAVLMAGVAIAALVAPFALVEAAAVSAADDVAKFKNAIELTGNYAGLTAQEYEDMARRVAAASNAGVGSARSALLELAKSGRFTGDEMEQLGQDALKFAQLSGKSAKDVLGDFVKMADGPARYAEEFSRTYHGAVTPAQLEHIQQLEAEGDRTGALAELTKDLTHWIADQTVHLGPAAGAFHGLGTAINDVWEALKRLNQGPTAADQLAAANASIAAIQKGQQGGRPLMRNTPVLLRELEQQRAALQAKADADKKAAEASAEDSRTQQQAIDAFDASHKTMLSLRSSADAAREAVTALQTEMAKRLRANPNDKEALDYQAHAAKYDQALMRKMDPGDDKKPAKPPGDISEWEEQLHAKQIAEKAYFKDSTADELAFWNAKVALTASGSKEWLAVQSKIYDLSKTLAHQAYDAHLATLADQMEADKDDWAREQADWKTRLDYIAGVLTEESAEYKAAHREMEAAERAHQKQMAQDAREGAQEALAELKSNLDAQKAIREANARTAEGTIQSGAKYDPVLGEVKAAAQIAAVHQQLAAQEMADEQAIQAKKDEILDQEIAGYAKDSDAYNKAVAQKKLADLDWANQQKVLANKAANEQIADQQKIAQAWHSTIDPMVSSVGTQFKGLIEGTETWQQAIVKIGEQGLELVIQAIEKMVEAWIVSMITGKAAQSATGDAQVASYAGIAGAAGVASMAGAPWPLDMTAPAFGASMSAAAMAFGTVASLAVGTNDVPADMMAQIHAGERIIPAADNRALMSAVAGGGAKGGDTHNHINYAPQLMPSGRSFKQDLHNHASDLMALVQTGIRRGSLKLA